jgi:hypothetical protein
VVQCGSEWSVSFTLLSLYSGTHWVTKWRVSAVPNAQQSCAAPTWGSPGSKQTAVPCTDATGASAKPAHRHKLRHTKQQHSKPTHVATDSLYSALSTSQTPAGGKAAGNVHTSTWGGALLGAVPRGNFTIRTQLQVQCFQKMSLHPDNITRSAFLHCYLIRISVLWIDVSSSSNHSPSILALTLLHAEIILTKHQTLPAPLAVW